MTASLIDRVRERLAAESASLRPNVVAAAIRAESGGVLGDTEVLSNLRVLQTELTGAGILEPLLRAEGVTDVLVTGPDSVWIDDGKGLRRSAVRSTAPRSSRVALPATATRSSNEDHLLALLLRHRAICQHTSQVSCTAQASASSNIRLRSG